MDTIKLGKFLSELRNEKKLTQDELAERLGLSSGKVISKWENGRGYPDFDILVSMSEILDVTLYEMSICERLKKPSLVEATKSKIKSSKDVLKMNIIEKIIIILGILFGVFLGFTAIYTFDNYKTVEIYEFKSLDDNFVIEGSVVHAKDYNVFNLISVGSNENDKTKYKVDVKDIEYEVLDAGWRVLLYNKQLSSKTNEIVSFRLLDNINSTSFSKSFLIDSFSLNDILTFKISYYEKDENKSIEFKFKLLPKFSN